MEFMLDTVNLDKIRYYRSVLPIVGVTSNPSILKQEGEIDFYKHLKEIKKIIDDASLHVQVVGESVEEILNDAEAIVNHLGKETFIKIPVNANGLAAIKLLKKRGFRVTATAIYTEFQGYLAIATGADYLAPYFNRMENLNIDSASIISYLAKEITRMNSSSKILAASFKNVAQVNQAIRFGAQAITASPDIFSQALGMPSIEKAVIDFHEDWRKTFHSETVADLVKKVK